MCSGRRQPAGEHYVADTDVRAGPAALLCRPPDTRAELHAVWRRDNENPTFRRFRETVLRRLADEVA
jgi:DNA-binding transcriptional LysR family regulator